MLPKTWGSRRLKGSVKSNPQKWIKNLIEPATLEAIFCDSKAQLTRGKDQSHLVEIANTVINETDALWADLESEQPNYACHKGCSWCCHQNVSVTWPELLKVLSYILKMKNAKSILSLAKRIKIHSQKVAGKSSNRRFDKKLACVFLTDNRCTVHSARPLQCRGGFSEEEQYCRDLLENRTATQSKIRNRTRIGKYLVAPKMIYNSAQLGLSQALDDENLDGNIYELTAAMTILMEHVKNKSLNEITPDDLAPALLRKSKGEYVTRNF